MDDKNRNWEWLNLCAISELKRGDEIQHLGNGIRYTVITNYGDRATAVRIADITNPNEWLVLRVGEP